MNPKRVIHLRLWGVICGNAGQYGQIFLKETLEIFLEACREVLSERSHHEASVTLWMR